MHRLNLRLTLVVLVLVLGAGVGLAIAVQKRGRGADTLSAQTVAGRAQRAANQLLDELGPNTTFHQVSVMHEQPGHPAPAPGPWILPEDRREELWATFGPDGALSAYAAFITDPSGKTVYQRVQLVNGGLIDTDVASGQTHTTSGSKGTVEGLRANLMTALSREMTLQQMPDDPSPLHASIRGRDTYVLLHVNPSGSTDRLYVDATSFRPVRQETIAVDGSVLDSSDYETLEVLTPGGGGDGTACIIYGRDDICRGNSAPSGAFDYNVDISGAP